MVAGDPSIARPPWLSLHALWFSMSGSLKKRLIGLLIFVGLFSLGVSVYAATELGIFGGVRFNGTPYPDSPPAPAFTLIDHRGETVSLGDFRGRALLLFFGFTRCPDVCPLTLDRLARVLDEAGLPPDRVVVGLITVDPEYDTPERMAEYVARFGPSVIGLTGDRATLEPIFKGYGVYAQEMPGHDGHPVLAHSSQVFGIDATGRLRVLMHADEAADLVEHDIRTLLRLGG